MNVGDEPPHQIHSYTLLFSLFHYFLYIINPPLHTPCTDATACNHTCTHMTITLTSLDQSMDTCFISILSIPNVHPPMVQPITSPHTTQPGTFYSFTSDEPYVCFLVCHSYLTCLYLPFAPEKNHTIYPYEFPPDFKLSTCASHSITFASHHFALHHTAFKSHCLYLPPHLEMIPYPQITPSEPHRTYT